jgi:hypothetical protein
MAVQPDDELFQLNPPPRRLLSLPEVAYIRGVPVRTILRQIKNGTFAQPTRHNRSGHMFWDPKSLQGAPHPHRPVRSQPLARRARSPANEPGPRKPLPGQMTFPGWGEDL